MQPLLQGLTDLADQAVVLPLMAAVGAMLAAGRWLRGAAGWFAGVAATLAAVLALKLAATACGLWPQSPSGHTASAAVVVGGLWWVCGRGRGALVAAGLAAVLIGATRLALGLHSVADVLVGGLAGVAGAALVRRLAGPRPLAARAAPVLFAAALPLLAMHGIHLGAEAVIRGIAADQGCRMR